MGVKDSMSSGGRWTHWTGLTGVVSADAVDDNARSMVRLGEYARPWYFVVQERVEGHFNPLRYPTQGSVDDALLGKAYMASNRGCLSKSPYLRLCR